MRQLYAQRLVDEGVVDEDEAQELVEERRGAAQGGARAAAGSRSAATSESDGAHPDAAAAPTVITAVPADRLRELNEELLRVPDGFTVHPKLIKQLQRRGEALEEGGIDWGHAEALAFASLLVEGIPIRLTGQDTERGTFSHRHLVLHDARDRRRLRADAAPREARRRRSRCTTRRSPSTRRVGFEYGYSVAAPEALVLWEAQFGDFVNGAQIVIDQFIVAGLSKWQQTSRLTLLLPHGYEGNGPEHSSARLERFLQLAAQENIRIANRDDRGAVLPPAAAAGARSRRRGR